MGNCPNSAFFTVSTPLNYTKYLFCSRDQCGLIIAVPLQGWAQPTCGALAGAPNKRQHRKQGGNPPISTTRRSPQRGDGRGENGTAPAKTGTGYERKDPYKAAPRCWAAAPQTTPEGRKPLAEPGGERAGVVRGPERVAAGNAARVLRYASASSAPGARTAETGKGGRSPLAEPLPGAAGRATRVGFVTTVERRERRPA